MNAVLLRGVQCRFTENRGTECGAGEGRMIWHVLAGIVWR